MSVQSIKIPNDSLFIPRDYGQLSVVYKNREFTVLDSQNNQSTVKREDLDNQLRNIPQSTLQKMLEVGFLRVSKRGEDYALYFNGRLPGGGPVGAIVGFVGTVVVGGVMVVGGVVLTPIGLGAGLAAAGGVVIAQAPVVAVVVGSVTPG